MIDEGIYKELAEDILQDVDYDIYKEDREEGGGITNMIIEDLKLFESIIRKEYETSGE